MLYYFRCPSCNADKNSVLAVSNKQVGVTVMPHFSDISRVTHRWTGVFLGGLGVCLLVTVPHVAMDFAHMLRRLVGRNQGNAPFKKTLLQNSYLMAVNHTAVMLR